MTPSTPMNLSKSAQDGIIQFHRQAYALLNQQWNIREQMRQIDLAYIREQDWTTEHRRAQLANKYGDADRFQNITVPVVMPQVEAAVEYQASVFLSGSPIFGVVSDPAFADQALQLETVIDSQALRGGWNQELLKFFRDGFKYNLSAIEVDWGREVTAALETDLNFSTTQAKPKEVIWEGNRLKRLDPYNMFYDVRVPLVDMHKKGEFVGYTELKSRIEMKDFINRLPDKLIENIKPAFESGLGAAWGGFSAGGIESYYIPQINPDALINKNIRATTDWLAWAGMSANQGNGAKIQYKNLYEVTTIYGKIIPSDFGMRVPSPNTPQVWKFIIVNHQVLIYAERQTNAHGWIPVLFGVPKEDGLMYQTKSLAQNVQPMQQVASALMNSVIASRRRAISDRVLYDPSRISEAHINSASPSAKIPVRPAAYGKSVSEAVYQFPFRDTEASISMQEIETIQRFANVITGQNPVRQGQFVKGNKTRHEFADVMSHANSGDQVTAMQYEAQVFTPLKEILKINILQYQGGISLFNREQQKDVQIDPVALRQAVLNFKISDGLIPSDKLLDADAWQVSLQTIGSSPQISSGYNIGPMFSYLMKMRGADLRPFQKSAEQVAYEQAMGQWQQLATLAIEKGTQFSQPQPKPQDYGYNPAQQGGPASVPQQTEVATRVNNITNNITNQEQ